MLKEQSVTSTKTKLSKPTRRLISNCFNVEKCHKMCGYGWPYKIVSYKTDCFYSCRTVKVFLIMLML